MSAKKNTITKVSMTIEHQADGQGNIATLHASQGEQAILTSFNYQNYDEFCQQLLQHVTTDQMIGVSHQELKP